MHLLLLGSLAALWLGLSVAQDLGVNLLPCNFTSTEEAVEFCDANYLEEWDKVVSANLAPWKNHGGIDEHHTMQAVKQYTTINKQKGIHMGWYDGRIYVIEATLEQGWLGHHANIFFTYMRVLLELEQLFGRRIPNMEFVLATSDRPMVLRPAEPLGAPGAGGRRLTGAAPGDSDGSNSEQAAGSRSGGAGAKPGTVLSAGNVSSEAAASRRLRADPRRRKAEDDGRPPPVMRFCSSPGHVDIHVPIFHFYTKKFEQRLLSQVPAINAKYPWERRQPLVFGRFSNYFRHVHPAVNATKRRGANHTRICEIDNPNTATCKVRQHLFDYAAAYPGQLDIRSSPHLPMFEHARYKYLVHVDGQALSSRLEQLLPLGSIIFKEESGYTAFYHSLIHPYQHYLPFWVKGPEDVLEALAWAKANDDKAAAIAAAGQRFALRFLTKRARTCYWFYLLRSYATLLNYKAEPKGGAMKREWVHVQEYFDRVAKPFEGGRWYTTKIEQ